MKIITSLLIMSVALVSACGGGGGGGGSNNPPTIGGEVIFARGDEGSWALLIEEGLVEISVMSLGGRKSVLNHMEKGDEFFWAGLV